MRRLRKLQCDRPHLVSVWPSLTAALESGESMQFSVRCLSSSDGLLSILTQHEQEKNAQNKLKVEDKEVNEGSSIFGSIMRSGSKPTGTVSKGGNKPSFSAPMSTSEAVAPTKQFRPFSPSQSDYETRDADRKWETTYDNRWVRLLNKTKPMPTAQQQPLSRPVMPVQQQKPPPRPRHQKIITISDDITTKMLAHKLGTGVSEVEQFLATLGEVPKSSEDKISMDAAELVAGEFGAIASKTASSITADEHTTTRPPVVTVMGHVDHGKTTLLDALRHTSVAAREAGGITQHIGAFEVALKDTDDTLTFLDTPGHAAFSAMRAHGARITDLVVLVVAADDGVMPQTKESLRFIREAGCQYVVAVTKCDLPHADVEKVKMGLGAESVELEDFGGNVQLIPISAVTGKGLKELQEALLLQAMNVNLTARDHIPATGVTVEANKNKSLGPVATVIVTGGTLRIGQPVVVGQHWGKIRQMKTSTGELLENVTPGRPVEICGLRGVPKPGDELMVVRSEDRARRVSTARQQRSQANIRHDNIVDDKGCLRVGFTIKADTQGTGEAVRKAVELLSSEVIGPEILHSSVGNVSEADIVYAEAVGAQILAFNVKAVDHDVITLAQHRNVTIHQYDVIYRLLDVVGQILLENAPLCTDENIVGEALVQQTFNIKCKGLRPKVAVAGCIVTSGQIQKSGVLLRVMRSDVTLFEGSCASLKRHKLDVERVGKGTECGIMLDSFQGVVEGDVIQAVLRTKRRPKTEDVEGGGLRVVEAANSD